MAYPGFQHHHYLSAENHALLISIINRHLLEGSIVSINTITLFLVNDVTKNKFMQSYPKHHVLERNTH